MHLATLQIDVMIDDTGVPAVRHTFFGTTQEEAQEKFTLHCNADSFLRTCFQHGGYNGIECRIESKWINSQFNEGELIT